MLRRLLLTVLGGCCVGAAFPAVGLWFLAPVGVALLVASGRGVRPGTGALLGFLGGLVWFVPYVSWTGLHVGVLPWFSLAVLESSYVALFVALVAALHRGWTTPPTAVVAATWSATEWARATTPFGGFPWGRVAYSQADSPLLHLVSVGGPGLLGFAVAFVGVAGLTGVDHLRHRRPPAQAVTPLVLGAAVLCLPPLVPASVDGMPARLMAIQGDAPRKGLDFNSERRQILDNHGRVTTEAARRVDAGELPRPDLVVWPENASDIDPFVNPDAGRVIDDAVDAIRRPVLVGAVLGGGRSDLTNTAVLWEPGLGATDQRYDKRQLVPFAEYMPYRAFFRAITRKVDLLERDFVPGHEPGLVDVPLQDGSGTLTAGIGICFEVAVDGVMDDLPRRANLLVVQTNNAMFDYSAESAQQLAISRVRAVQYGRSVVHSSNVGITALITPDGVAHHQTGLFTPAVVIGTLPLRREVTLATRLGNLPEWSFVVLAGVGLLAPRLPGRRRSRGPRR